MSDVNINPHVLVLFFPGVVLSYIFCPCFQAFLVTQMGFRDQYQKRCRAGVTALCI